MFFLRAAQLLFVITKLKFSTQFSRGKTTCLKITPSLGSKQGLGGQKGQALIEYIFVLIIVIGILIFATAKIFQPTQQFMNQLTGEAYIGCLLETGTLPTLSGESTVAEDSDCIASFNPGDSAAMTANPAGSGDSGSNRNRDRRPGAEGDGDDGRNGRSRGGRGPTLGGGSTSKAHSGVADGKDVGDRFDEGGGEDGSVFKNARARGGGGNTGDSSSVGSGNASFGEGTLSEGQRAQLKTKDGKAKVAVPGTEEEIAGNQRKPFKMKRDIRDIASVEEEEEFSIGIYFKYFIIICIILVLVLVVGGQFLQMTKNLDRKG